MSRPTLPQAADRHAARSGSSDLARRLQSARKLLVIDSGGLGDHIHSLPALWLLRQNNADAALHVLGGHGLFGAMTPWIDHVWPYARRGLQADLRWIARLRAERYDAALVLTSSNHAAAIGGLCGAPLRLARRADANKRWWWQPWLHTRIVEQPFHRMPMYRQRWQMLKDLGLQGSAPEFRVEIAATARRAAGIDAADDGRYLHLSANATDDRRDLPITQQVALWNALHARFPTHRIAVSADATARGRSKLQALLQQIEFVPWRVFDGTLDIAGFASVVQGAAAHVGPDSGGLHIARVAGTRSVSWFRQNHHLPNWFPDDPERHQAFIAPESRDDGLHGLDNETLIDAVARALASRASASEA